MAKILANKHSSSTQMIKLRQKLGFCQEELLSLDEKYNEKIEKELNSFLIKANKQLLKPAFDACDKEEYAEAILNGKLQKYDVKSYRKVHRANHHGAAKQIFKRVKSGASYDDILVNVRNKYNSHLSQREKYITSLDKDRVKFVQDHPNTSKENYDRLKLELEKQYMLKKQELEKKYGDQHIKEKEKLEQKISAINNKIELVKSKATSNIALPDDVLLEVKGLKMYFGGLKAVDDLSFSVKKGEIFGLIGPNGAGKTTVFNCITRFYDATGGEMYFENKYGEVVDLRAFKVHDIILQGIGRTFQNIELVKEISVLENLLIAATRSYRSTIFEQAIGSPKLKKEEKILRAKAKRILKFMGLENYAEWYAMGLPYGLLKKVEIARALMADAKLIIMDEPAAGLNDSETAELTETIRKIRDEFGVTILLVEHDMGLVMNVCDTVCAISFGQMLGIGTTEEIQKNRAVQEAYLGVAEEE